MSFKVPPFISEYLNGLPTHEERQEAVERYRGWYEHDFTELLISYLEEYKEKLIQEDEKKSDFLTKFQFTYNLARNKAKRELLRDLLKKLNHEV